MNFPVANSCISPPRCRAPGLFARRLAQAYPTRPVRILVGFAAGGGSISRRG